MKSPSIIKLENRAVTLDTSFFITPEFLNVLVTSALIFCARILDVSIGTLRIISVTKGRKYLAPMLGFLEILIWLTAISQVLRTMTNPFYFIAYASGFALGNFVGIQIEGRLALGMLVVRIITGRDSADLQNHLSGENYGVTSVDACGAHGPVKMIYTIIKRKDLEKVASIIREHNPQAFYSVEEVQAASKEIFPLRQIQKRRRLFDFSWMTRKGK